MDHSGVCEMIRRFRSYKDKGSYIFIDINMIVAATEFQPPGLDLPAVAVYMRSGHVINIEASIVELQSAGWT